MSKHKRRLTLRKFEINKLDFAVKWSHQVDLSMYNSCFGKISNPFNAFFLIDTKIFNHDVFQYIMIEPMRLCVNMVQ